MSGKDVVVNLPERLAIETRYVEVATRLDIIPVPRRSVTEDMVAVLEAESPPAGKWWEHNAQFLSRDNPCPERVTQVCICTPSTLF